MQQVIELAGSFRVMGRQYGEELREATRAMCELRIGLVQEKLHMAGSQVDRGSLLALATEHVAAHTAYCPDAYEELVGIAEGSGLSVEELVIGNGYTDFSDVALRRFSGLGNGPGLSECTSIAAWSETDAPSSFVLGQTWDMEAAVSPYILCVIRRPDRGPRTVSLTTAGALSLIGMNEHGVCVGNTNLTARDARPGVFYLATIHTMLAQSALDDAVERCISSPRASGHYFYVGEPSGRFAGIECSAKRHALMDTNGRYFAHTNHYLDEGLAALARVPKDANTEQRLERAAALLSELPQPVDVTLMSTVLQDTEMAFPICRAAVDPREAASVAAVLMEPTQRRFNYLIGDPRESAFRTIEP